MIVASLPMTLRLEARCLLLAALAANGVYAQDSPVVEKLPGDAGGREPLVTVIPSYPEKARSARVEGEVEVCFNVDRDGKTHRVAVRRSSNRVFEKPARDAVRASTYRPLREGETLSGIKTCRTFRFSLEPVESE